MQALFFQMRRKKPLDPGIKIDDIFILVETVRFIGIDHVLDVAMAGSAVCASAGTAAMNIHSRGANRMRVASR